ncbi:MAG: uracil-DNA glycosylase [Alphaproteobacteria bacterium PA3]|nr:MAG: uracil-DNA glycosylase [Alphaproteobacteria bacterium PA3]
MGTVAILRAIAELRFENTFNPYVDRCPVYDTSDAPDIRRDYLAEMLDRAALWDLDAIWVGRDLGYRGGRRTGLALTDDVHHADHLSRWDLAARRPTIGEPVAERTATVIWDILSRLDVPIFMWNVFPLHPHDAGNPFTNRAHNARERRAGVEILMAIVRVLQPRRIVAVGNDAYAALAETLGPDRLHKARHPSYGGQTEFLATMKSLYAGQIAEDQPDLFGSVPRAA